MTHKTPPPTGKPNTGKAGNTKNSGNAKNAGKPADKAATEQTAKAQQVAQPAQPAQSQPSQPAPQADTADTAGTASNAANTANAAQDKSTTDKPSKPGNPAKRGVQRTVTYIEPISALKMALIFNLALFAVWFVAMALIYIVLGAAGTWDRLDSLVGDLTNSSGFSAGMYFGGVVALGLFEVVLFTLLAPIAALIYNASSSILGGVRIQLDR
ncbi:DUF3566 domain-containing protein [Corynebacterium sp. c9Ua_112]|uniref:DUF3566 domain-containing protein n=1 Tax=Corynebacterium macclintockiae TaxID=2913501 RepID=A0A9X3M6K9_9CORY|nr:DUF3566 domain-containing protein [Corynebacterium macclintockiae]MCZ9305115.1 DUF3566 domain-containing protein [Corynebacterium macclintockiae]